LNEHNWKGLLTQYYQLAFAAGRTQRDIRVRNIFLDLNFILHD